jgi:dihydropteroate synthase
VKDTAFWQSQSIEVNGSLIEFNKPLTMGIINVTSDSFFAGSRAGSPDAVAERALQMQTEGADIIDLGAYSTRPGAQHVPVKLERELLTEAIKAVRSACPDAVISADTFRAEVAEAAVGAGAHIVNDVGGGMLDANMYATMAALGVPYILMHNRGTPQNMQEKAQYRDVVNEVVMELSAKMETLYALGVADVMVDPGFGFAKTAAHNFELLMRLEELKVLNAPLLIGLSRKGMVWRTLNTSPEKALNGSTALHMLALERGAQILRVHDVKEAVEAVSLWEACKVYA